MVVLQRQIYLKDWRTANSEGMHSTQKN